MPARASLRLGVLTIALPLAACSGARPGGQPELIHAPAEPRAESPEAMRVHLIDVGQGAATLVEFPCAAVLVDTGGEDDEAFHSGEALGAYLDAFFERRKDLARTLALVVLTHPHKDHTLNVKRVVTYGVSNVVTDGLTKGSGGSQQRFLQDWARDNAKLATIDAADVPPGGLTSPIIDPVACPGVDPKIAVLWGRVDERPRGWTADAFEDANDHSVVVRIDAGEASLLVTGDLEVAAVPALIDRHRGTGALDADVWEVSHHGSANGANAALLDAISPEIALLATGDARREFQWTAWDYGHPRKSTIDLLLGNVTRARPSKTVEIATAQERFEPLALDRAIYATGWDGSVVVTARMDGTYSVDTGR